MCCIWSAALNPSQAEMNKKLHQRSVKQANKVFWMTEIFALAGVTLVQWAGYENQGKDLITGIIVALVLYHAGRRILKGPPVGVAMLEASEDMLIFRNPSNVPPRVERIAIEKLHSIRLNGERHLRYFVCMLMSGENQRVGPFERGPGEMAIADWFKEALPDIAFLVDTSATPMAQMEGRPPGL
jgi:hypothetical protein